jgi:ribosomal protein L11 methyltransferase
MNKNKAQWQQLSLLVDKTQALILAEQLTKIGALATSFAAHTPQNYINHNVGEIDFIGQIELTALFSEDFDPRIVNLLLEQEIPLESWQIIREEDWRDQWKKDLKPINFNQRLTVIPSWYQDYNDPYQKLILDAGAAFGTGSHPTTYLCLDWLSKNISGGENVLDFGCGSGILGIAAGLLGAQQVILTDIDQLALETAYENAALNQVQVSCYLPDELPKNLTVDLLIANILASVLIQLYPIFLEYLVIGGQIVLSGILFEQEALIYQVFGQHFSLQTVAKDEWLLISGTRVS